MVAGPLMESWQYPYAPQPAPDYLPPAPRRRRQAIVGLVALIVLVASGVIIVASPQAAPPSPQPAGTNGPVSSSAPSSAATILGFAPQTLDPALQSDQGTAEVVSQLFETLTLIDSSGHIQPALATGWTTSNGGKTIVFKLRPGLQFSDGSPMAASDVVNSWFRVLNPAKPSNLADLLYGVVGARAYSEGSGPKSAVGISAPASDQVQIDLVHPAGDFPAIASSPTLAVVPAQVDSNPSLLRPGTFVGSGGYTVSALTDSETTLKANPHYWAGEPAIKTIHLLSTIGGKDEVSEFQAGHLDYTPVSLYNATWVAYDRRLGPNLRAEPPLVVEYYGFDTKKAPFSDARVRRAFEFGVNWRRLVQLVSDPLETPATSMVPAGVPGHTAADVGPVFDVAKAKAELAAAGFPNGAGFPKVTLVTTGSQLDEAVVKQLHDNLGIDIGYEILDGALYQDRLLNDPPAFWEEGWGADYPGANDFLGLLLGTGATNNFGRWSSSEFDGYIEQALSATDPAAIQQGYDKAQALIQDQAPVIPVDYSAGYALANPKLLGAVPDGDGFIRFAGLAWSGR
jgi:oligopeptide transport system substrate-binding protein